MTVNNRVGNALRRLADDVETGRWKGWTANMVMSRPEVERDPLDEECRGFRYFRTGDEVTVLLTLKAPGDT